MDEPINWGELGRDWWLEAGRTVGATEQQVIFAACRHKGMTATGSAKAAGYAGDQQNIRQAGQRAAHSTAVMSLLSMAAAESGAGPDGNVTMGEAKQILSRLARGSDPNVRIKAIESLTKIEREERELELRQREGATSATSLRNCGRLRTSRGSSQKSTPRARASSGPPRTLHEQQIQGAAECWHCLF